MRLTPEEIDDLHRERSGYWALGERVGLDDVGYTLAAYAEIVEQMALERPHINITDGQDSYITVCRYCEGGDNLLVPDSHPYQWELEHEPDCLWVAARKLRGKE